jgi:hypothetical protein
MHVTPIKFEDHSTVELRAWWDAAEGVAKEMGVPVAQDWKDRLEAELNRQGILTRDEHGVVCASQVDGFYYAKAENRVQCPVCGSEWPVLWHRAGVAICCDQCRTRNGDPTSVAGCEYIRSVNRRVVTQLAT